MDRLRAAQYFIAAAEEKSLSGAARRFEVSVGAVAKLVSALEKSLGTRLVDRTAKGLTLTAAGATYLEACGAAIAQLKDADEQVRSSLGRTPGTVVVGVQNVVARAFLAPALARFRAASTCSSSSAGPTRATSCSARSPRRSSSWWLHRRTGRRMERRSTRTTWHGTRVSRCAASTAP
jgi:molybdenum-dependent DNA-binding transcriptional regulator ModE